MDYKEQIKLRDNLVNILKEKGVMEKITLKKIKTEIGHDLAGFYCDFYLKGFGKIGYINDDGWGGEVLPTYESSEKQEVIEKFLKDNDIAQTMFDNGWEFMKSVKSISFDTQIASIIELKLNEVEDEKFKKKLMRATEKGIVFGTTSSYSSISFKMPLKAIALHKNGVEILQREYNRAKTKLKKDEKIFNENLEELGIKL